MTIYYTPFNPETREWTAPSEPMDAFASMDQVRQIMGPPTSGKGNFLIYPGAAYSCFPCRIDGPVIEPVTLLQKNTGSTTYETQA